MTDKPEFELHTVMQQQTTWLVLGEAAVERYCQLEDGQPLLIQLDPEGTDPRLVALSDLYNNLVGFIPPGHAIMVTEAITGGALLQAKVIGPRLCVVRHVYIWSDREHESNAIELERKTWDDEEYRKTSTVTARS